MFITSQQKFSISCTYLIKKDTYMPFGIQPLHIAIIIVVALLFFGPKRLPEVGRYIGKTINEFRTGTQELTSSLREEVNKPAQAAATPEGTSSIPASPPPSVIGGNFCTQCGSSNSAEARFCGNCGSRLIEKTT
jgi:TatA/E family protein of Tat protein translocase